MGKKVLGIVEMGVGWDEMRMSQNYDDKLEVCYAADYEDP